MIERKLTATEESELLQLLRAGQNVSAIKRYRQIVGCELAESLAWINALIEREWPKPPDGLSGKSATT